MANRRTSSKNVSLSASATAFDAEAGIPTVTTISPPMEGVAQFVPGTEPETEELVEIDPAEARAEWLADLAAFEVEYKLNPGTLTDRADDRAYIARTMDRVIDTDRNAKRVQRQERIAQGRSMLATARGGEAMGRAALEELEEKAADLDEVQAHIRYLEKHHVPNATMEKALHTVASFFSLVDTRTDNHTGEIVKVERNRNLIEQVLNGVCYSLCRSVLNEEDDYSLARRIEKGRAEVRTAQRALINDEISANQLEAKVDWLEKLEMMHAAGLQGLEIAERVYKERTGREFKRPVFRSKKPAQPSSQSDKAAALARAARHTGVSAVDGEKLVMQDGKPVIVKDVAVETDRFDSATQSADER